MANLFHHPTGQDLWTKSKWEWKLYGLSKSPFKPLKNEIGTWDIKSQPETGNDIKCPI